MKPKTIFSCQSCGYQAPKWQGRCPDCNNWNSFTEENFAAPAAEAESIRITSSGEPVLLNSVESIADKRIFTKIGELDRVLGGGIVPGSVTLLAGDPGIGKSTLALQAAARLAEIGAKTLYVSGEESVKQVKLRADRLIGKTADKFYLVNQTDLNLIAESIKKLSPAFVIIDSIQAIGSSAISAGFGSVSQVRECAGQLTSLAKALSIAIFIIGHVTKDGAIAGPRVLEHIVDTVLYFEGERYSVYRILRAVKNRFGSTNEIGIFEMASTGLKEVTSPSQVFLTERPQGASGSIVACAMEGTRPILAEIQALVSRGNFGFAQRKAEGIDYNRLSLLTAVLEKRAGLSLGAEDIFVNVAGGLKLEDPACDLGIVLAVASSFKNKTVSADIVALGEVGLAGEVRSVSYVDLRIREAEKLGFKRCLLPKNNLKDKVSGVKSVKIEFLPVSNIKEALDIVLS